MFIFALRSCDVFNFCVSLTNLCCCGCCFFVCVWRVFFVVIFVVVSKYNFLNLYSPWKFFDILFLLLLISSKTLLFFFSIVSQKCSIFFSSSPTIIPNFSFFICSFVFVLCFFYSLLINISFKV